MSDWLCVWCGTAASAGSKVGCSAPDGDGHLFRAPRVVIDLAQQRHKRLTLAVFDAMARADKRESMDEKARIERKARNLL